MLLNNGKRIELAPQGLAELVPQMVQGYYYPQAIGLELERKFAILSEMYQSQPWIYTCVNKRANAIARLSVDVWNEGGGTRQLDSSSGYAKLMNDPCPYLDPFRFWFWIQACKDIYGEAYCAIMRDGSTGKPIGLLPMHPTRVAIRRDAWDGTYEYTFQAGAGYGDGLVQFGQDDVVPFLEFNPLKLERGMSRLEPLRSTLIAEDSSRNAQSAAWKHGGRPGVVLTTDKRLGDEGRKRLKDSFQSTHGGSSQAGQALVLEDGLKAAPLQLTAVEMQMIESRQLNREEICAVFDIAPTIVHILDHATFCLPADARISTELGPKKIVDVKAGERVWSFDGRGLVLSEVEWSGQTGTLPLYTVKTANRTLRATGNHPVLVARPQWGPGTGRPGSHRRRIGVEYVWVRVDELSVGDILVAAHGFSSRGKRSHAPNGREITQEFMEFCGLLLGDGTVNGGRSAGVSIAHAKGAGYIEHYRHCAEALFENRSGGPVIWHAGSDRSSRFCSASAARELVELGFGGNAHTKSIPAWVFECPETMRLALLRGLLEADGSVDKKGRISFSLCNEQMVHQVRDLMMGLGVAVTNVRHTNYEVTLPNGQQAKSNMWGFTATDPGANQFISSWDERDLERLNNGKPFGEDYYRYRTILGEHAAAPIGGQFSRITAITQDDTPVPVYDLTVPGTSSFVADGLVVHNSNIASQLRAFYRDTMAPAIEAIESALDFYVGKYWQGQKAARFAIDDVIRGDFEIRADAAARLATVGGLTPDEVRELMGYSAFDGEHAERARRLYANAAMQPLGEPAERITLTGPVGHDPDGVALDLAAQGVPTTTVPAGGDSSSGSGIDVPQLTESSASSSISDSVGVASLPEARVSALDYSSRPLRELKGGIGRGQDIRELAMRIATKYPDHLNEILVAVQIAIAEKNCA